MYQGKQTKPVALITFTEPYSYLKSGWANCSLVPRTDKLTNHTTLKPMG